MFFPITSWGKMSTTTELLWSPAGRTVFTNVRSPGPPTCLAKRDKDDEAVEHREREGTELAPGGGFPGSAAGRPVAIALPRGLGLRSLPPPASHMAVGSACVWATVRARGHRGKRVTARRAGWSLATRVAASASHTTIHHAPTHGSSALTGAPDARRSPSAGPHGVTATQGRGAGPHPK